jgi:hypothetical protein
MIDSGVYAFGRNTMFRITNVFGMKMASVFMISLGTIWLRTGVMPRLLAIVTFVAALVLLLSLSLSVWMVLMFPGWVFVISVYILTQNLGRRRLDTTDGMTTGSVAEEQTEPAS